MLAARDHCGIKPLYMGYGENGSIWFASELKAICDQCDTIEEFPAGYYWTPASGFVKYYNPEWDDDNYVGVKVITSNKIGKMPSELHALNFVCKLAEFLATI